MIPEINCNKTVLFIFLSTFRRLSFLKSKIAVSAERFIVKRKEIFSVHFGM